jgi:hypothetical protein
MPPADATVQNPLQTDRGAVPQSNSNAAELRDERAALGANHLRARLGKGFAVRDGSLITGPQNLGGAETAALLVEE